MNLERTTFDRAEVFGAIRRAVKVAREYEHVANTRPYNAAGKAALRYRARSIRYAIRAAIGSPKT